MKRVTLLAGHYGSGKTNIAVNYALALAKTGQKTLIADLDIVNPYFRTRDSEGELQKAGVRIIVSPYANTNVDVPALPPEMYAIVDDKSYACVVDVGGDDRGALALGRLTPGILQENDYDMFFVANFFRPLTQTAKDAMTVLREVEAAGGLPFTGILHNSNLGGATQAGDILSKEPLALKLSELCALPLIATCAREDLAPGLRGKVQNLMPIKLHFRGDWAIF